MKKNIYPDNEASPKRVKEVHNPFEHISDVESQIEPEKTQARKEIVNPFRHLCETDEQKVEQKGISLYSTNPSMCVGNQSINVPVPRKETVFDAARALSLLSSLDGFGTQYAEPDVAPRYSAEKISTKRIENAFISHHSIVIVKGVIYFFNGFYYVCLSEDQLTAKIQTFCTRVIGDKTAKSIIDGVMYLVTHDERVINDALRSDTNFVAFKNGLYSIRDRTLRPHTPEIFAVHHVNANFLSNIENLNQCPLFVAFLTKSTGGSDPLSWRLLELYTTEISPLKPKQVSIVFGPSNSGKSVFLSIVRKTVGDEDCANFTIRNLSERFGLADANDKNLLMCPDAAAGVINETAAETLKTLVSSEDSMDSERKNVNKCAMTNNRLKVIIATNHELTSVIYDNGIRNRFKYFPMPVATRREEQIDGLSDKLMSEADVFVSFCFTQVLPRLIATNFAFTGEVEAAAAMSAVSRYLSPEDGVEEFLNKCCAITADKGRFITTEHLFQAYISYPCDGVKITEKKKFSAVANKILGADVIKKKASEEGERRNAFYGLEFKSFEQ